MERLKVVETLLKVSQFAGELALHDKVVHHVLNHRNLYNEIELVGLFLKLDESNYTTVLLQLGVRLQKQVSAPRQEGDWSIRDDIPDNCSDCQYLKNFLVSVSTQKLVWPLAKDRRSHIHQMIDAMDIPVTHETLHQGSPHKLVLTKTTELFKKDKERAKSIETCLSKLRSRELVQVGSS